VTIRVLVVDDSPTMRALLSRQLEREADIEVAATAKDAKEARALIKQLDPDVVTLDIEMPGMDGLSFLEKIMTLRPTPVIIVSGSTQAGTTASARALRLGAIGCYAKSSSAAGVGEDDTGELARLVREAAKVQLAPHRPSPRDKSRDAPTSPASRPSLIAIGSSTGGVEALHTLLAGFPVDCPPTLVVQHIGACFAPAIARNLDANAAPRVELAESDTPLRHGHVYFAPGNDTHLCVAGAGTGKLRCILREGPPVSGHCPSVDRLFSSVAKRCGSNALGVLLTGMGDDGASGLLEMRKAGARTIAQDKDSCVVFGMPRAAIDLGAAGEVLPLGEIARGIFAAHPQMARAQ
jgi:two-component system chemotaxis response regulator CheB